MLRSRSFFLTLVLAIAGMLVSVTSAGAGHNWGNWHWYRTANPATLQIVDSMTGAWDSLLGPVNADWNQSSVLENSVVPGGDLLPEREACLMIDGKIHACNAPYADATWLGLATVLPTDLTFTHIKSATVQVNDTWFDTLYNDNVARRHVLCQEVGHVFGLDHWYSEPSCMDDGAENPDTIFDPAYQYPATHDMQELSNIYSHLDGSGGGGSGGGGGGGGGCKGKKCQSSANVERIIKEIDGQVVMQIIIYPPHVR